MRRSQPPAELRGAGPGIPRCPPGGLLGGSGDQGAPGVRMGPFLAQKEPKNGKNLSNLFKMFRVLSLSVWVGLVGRTPWESGPKRARIPWQGSPRSSSMQGACSAVAESFISSFLRKSELQIFGFSSSCVRGTKLSRCVSIFR